MYHVCAHLLDTSTSTGTVIEMKDNVVPGTGTGTGTKMRCTLTHMYHTNRHRIGNSTVQQLHVQYRLPGTVYRVQYSTGYYIQ